MYNAFTSYCQLIAARAGTTVAIILVATAFLTVGDFRKKGRIAIWSALGSLVAILIVITDHALAFFATHGLYPGNGGPPNYYKGANYLFLLPFGTVALAALGAFFIVRLLRKSKPSLRSRLFAAMLTLTACSWLLALGAQSMSTTVLVSGLMSTNGPLLQIWSFCAVAACCVSVACVAFGAVCTVITIVQLTIKQHRHKPEAEATA